MIYEDNTEGGKLSTREEASFSQCFDSVSTIFTCLVTEVTYVPLLLCLTTHQVSDADESCSQTR